MWFSYLNCFLCELLSFTTSGNVCLLLNNETRRCFTYGAQIARKLHLEKPKSKVYFTKTMTKVLEIIHRPSCGPFHLGTIFFLPNHTVSPHKRKCISTHRWKTSTCDNMWHTVQRAKKTGLCIGKNVAVRYISRYRGYHMIYLLYCKQSNVLQFFSI